MIRGLLRGSLGYGKDEILSRLVDLARELNRFPTTADLRVRTANQPDFPDTRTIQRTLGNKAEMVLALSQFCENREDCSDVAALCAKVAKSNIDEPPATTPSVGSNDGFVYIIKSGRFFKIGKTNSAGRREREIAILLPERTKTVHVIKTDDPTGIEEYWHKRFASKRKNGEWFDLTQDDIAAFRRRKFM